MNVNPSVKVGAVVNTLGFSLESKLAHRAQGQLPKKNL